MASYQKAKDISLQRRTPNGKFEEYAVIVQPNSYLISNAANDIVAISASDAVIFSTASWAFNSVHAISSDTSSVSNLALTALTASYVNVSTASYAFNSSTSSQAITSYNISGSSIATVRKLVTTAQNNTQVQAGLIRPLYLVSDVPAIGYNAYYDSGWRYGPANTASYGAFQLFDTVVGELICYFSSTEGNSDILIPSTNTISKYYVDGRIAFPSTFTRQSLIQSDASGFLTGISITGSTYPITSSYSITSSFINANNITEGTLNNSILSSQINVSGITASFVGNLIGTASWSNNEISSSYSQTATSASYALTASYAGNVPDTASYALASLQSVTSSYSITTFIPIVVQTGSLTQLLTSNTSSYNALFIKYKIENDTVSRMGNLNISFTSTYTSFSDTYTNDVLPEVDFSCSLSGTLYLYCINSGSNPITVSFNSVEI